MTACGPSCVRVVALEAETGASHETPGERGRTFTSSRTTYEAPSPTSARAQRPAGAGASTNGSPSSECDAQTRLAPWVAYGLIQETAAFKMGITPAVRELIHAPSRRTPIRSPAPTCGASGSPPCASASPTPRRRPRPKAGSSHHAASSYNGASAQGPGAPGSGAHGRRPGNAAIRAHGGHYEDIMIAEARRSKVPVSLVCAVMEDESSFTNVFGHDPVRNPIKEHPGKPNLVVTEALYKTYLHHRDRGEGEQDVGPMQLERLPAGCRGQARRLLEPGPNIRVGVARLGAHGPVRRHPRRAEGLPRSSAYADHRDGAHPRLHDRLEGHTFRAVVQRPRQPRRSRDAGPRARQAADAGA